MSHVAHALKCSTKPNYTFRPDRVGTPRVASAMTHAPHAKIDFLIPNAPRHGHNAHVIAEKARCEHADKNCDLVTVHMHRLDAVIDSTTSGGGCRQGFLQDDGFAEVIDRQAEVKAI